MIKYAIFGGNGKMGREVIKIAPNFAKSATLEKIFISNKIQSGESKGIPFSIKEVEGLNFIIDFSIPAASIELARSLVDKNILIVCGTTGFTTEQMTELKLAAKCVKILYSANFSLGMNAIFAVLQKLTMSLSEYKIEITEKHHALKKDAPSGTALALGEIIQNVSANNFETMSTNILKKDIKYNVVREGICPGFHEVLFENDGERIWIGHESCKKEIFASGAIKLGIKGYSLLAGQKNGFFNPLDL